MKFASSGMALSYHATTEGVHGGINGAIGRIKEMCARCREEHHSSKFLKAEYANFATECCIVAKCISKKPPGDYHLCPIEVKDLDTGKKYKVYTVVVEDND